MTATGIGAAVRRKEDHRFITGKGHYTDDINRPGQAYAYFVRSPHAHATIKSIDVKAAASMPGVLRGPHRRRTCRRQDRQSHLRLDDPFQGRLADEDGAASGARQRQGLPCRRSGRGGGCRNAGAGARCRREGQSRLRGAAGRRRSGAAQRPGAPQIHDVAPNNTIYQWHLGDPKAVDAAFKAAKHVTKLDIVNNRLVPNAIEPRAAIAEYDAGTGTFTLWNTTQNPHVARLVIAAFVGMAPEHKLRVIAPDVGGGFGSKIFIYPEEVVALWASKRVGRPVKWVSDRSEAFLTDAHGRDHVTHAEMAFDADGKILGASRQDDRQSRRLYVDVLVVGADLSLRHAAVGPVPDPADLLRGRRGLHQHQCRSMPIAAPGVRRRPSWSSGWSRSARAKWAQDPAELRRKNFIKTFPHQTPVIMTYDAGDYDASLKKAMELADYKGFAKRKREAARHGKLRGIGFSTYIEACGIAPSQAVGSLGAGVGLWESAEVRVNPTGSVEVLTGSHSHGQGHETTFAQLVSERLGIPIENVSVVHGDTDKVQFGMGTYGSRSGAVGMSAIVKALDKVEAKAKKVAAHLLEAAEGDIEFKDGKFSVAGTDKSAAWGDVTLNAYIAHKFSGQELEPGLKEGAFYDPTNFTFPAGCHICEVEVDPETGNTEIVAWTAVDDFGVIVNPMIVEGQVHGGIAQGIGQALCEGAIYDKDGQLVTGSFMDYAMPRADYLPTLKVETTVTKCPSNPLGIKGCGEAGAIAAPAAVINAITDAIGTEALAMPATPPAVWAALQKSRKSVPHAA